ncbi:MAG: hypothetical protein NZ929_04580 [Aigarchaeota archaeon]|nr:hypothetical protein [Aigarchaeota archaeon]MCX8193544.1 hypothetical protein [Nitrososphaeria archaeon]MDW7986684.1 hypothetical protein [Nitrososphaerota archaeon]
MVLEGFYLNVDGDIYAVKGVLHPLDKVIAIPVYTKSTEGKYHRIRSLRESIKYLEKNKPKYLEKLDFTGQITPVVPLSDVKRIYNPLEFYEVSTEPARDAIAFKKMIESSIDIEVGVSGSILLRLDSFDSDIDLVVYGLEAGQKLYKFLRELRFKEIIKPVRSPDWIIETRSDSTIPPERWLELESRKLLTGIFRDRLYTMKIVPLPSEYWETTSQKVRDVGRSTLTCKIVGSRYSITTPNLYNVEILETLYGETEASRVSYIMSMRSRFSELADVGDKVEVEGRLEEVRIGREITFRIFIGNDERDRLLPLEKI